MKNRELIAILSELDEDAEVFVMMQQKWPFECSLAGVAVREDFSDGGDEEESTVATPSGATRGGERANDIFLVEGAQLRYGSKAAWDVARRQ